MCRGNSCRLAVKQAMQEMDMRSYVGTQLGTLGSHVVMSHMSRFHVLTVVHSRHENIAKILECTADRRAPHNHCQSSAHVLFEARTGI